MSSAGTTIRLTAAERSIVERARRVCGTAVPVAAVVRRSIALLDQHLNHIGEGDEDARRAEQATTLRFVVPRGRPELDRAA